MPISVPPYMPIAPRERPNIDIAGSIGGLGDALQQGLEFGQKRKIDRATRAALASGLTTGPDGLPDYMTAAGNILAGGGDTDTALTLARLAETQTQNQWLRGYKQSADANEIVRGPDGSLYRKGDLFGGSDAAAQPQQPADTGYDPTDPNQPPEPPQQQADSGGPEPVIRGPKKPPQRRTGIDAQGNTVTEEAGEDGVWRIVSGPKKATPKSPKGPTADESKNRQIYSIVAPDLAIVDETFGALSDPENQTAAALTPERFRNYTVSPEYQRALTALESIVRQSIYSESGATAPPEEVRGLALSMMPTLGEHATSVADKKRRVHTMVESIRLRGNMPGSVENAGAPDATAPQQAGPQPGDVEDGYRFLGGDPTDPDSWEPE